MDRIASVSSVKSGTLEKKESGCDIREFYLEYSMLSLVQYEEYLTAMNFKRHSHSRWSTKHTDIQIACLRHRIQEW